MKSRAFSAIILLAFLCCASLAAAQTVLTADGQTDTYKLITNALAPGATPYEVPDTADPANAPHIRQVFDDQLGRYVLQFFIHLQQDDDPSTGKDDRQRNEIKTYASSPTYLKGYAGEKLTYRWRFKLDAAFQPSPYFTHIHQIKPVDGNDSNPVITLTPVAATPNSMQLRYMDEAGNLIKLKTTDLAPFLGTWVEAYETATLAEQGSYSLMLTRVSDGAVLLAHTEANINLLRTGSSFYRPKWGIYRSITAPTYLRDEVVLFDRFCLAKGADDCAPASFNLSVTPTSQTVSAGSTATYSATVAPVNGFSAPITFACSGLPAGAVCAFSPATLTPAGSPLSTSVTITTAQRSARIEGRLASAFAMFVPGIVLISLRRGSVVLALLVLALALPLLACGGGGGSFYSSQSTRTPSTYNAVLTASSGSVQRTATLTLTVN